MWSDLVKRLYVRNVLLALSVEIYPTHATRALVEADVIEPLETGTRDCLDFVIRHQEVLFPPHEEVFSMRKLLKGEGG